MRKTLLLLLLLPACAGPLERIRPDLPIEFPDGWAAGGAPGTGPAAWWTTFGDDRIDALVREAIQKNPNLIAAGAAVRAAAAQASIVGSEMAPQVFAGGQGARQKQIFVGLPIPGTGGVLSSRSTSYGVSLDLSWEVDLWGRIRSGQAAAIADLQAAQADLAGAQLSLMGQTIKAWFAAVEARRQVELSESTVESLRVTTRRIRKRYQRGLRHSLDLRLASSNFAAAESVLGLRREQEDRVRRQLEVLLARYPAGEIDATGDLPGVPPPVPAGLPSSLLKRRPDLAAAERRVAAADARVGAAEASLYPRLSLTGSTGRSSGQLSDLLDGDFSVWSFAGNLLQPIFQGKRLWSGLDLASADADRVKAGYVDGVLRALGEVESALAAEGFLSERQRALESAADHAREALQSSENRYAAGLLNIMQLLEAQRRSYDAESQRLTVRRLRLDARVNLHLALGGGFSIED